MDLAALFSALEVLIIERLPSGQFVRRGELPRWCLALPTPPLDPAAFPLVEVFPVLTSFLASAEQAWCDGPAGRVTSGFFHATAEDGQELHLSAVALRVGQAQVLVIARNEQDFAEQKLVLQRARELRLAYDARIRELKQKDVLLHTTVHELASPLHTILGRLQLLSELPPAQPTASWVHAALQAALRQQQVLGDILDGFSAERDSAPRPTPAAERRPKRGRQRKASGAPSAEAAVGARLDPQRPSLGPGLSTETARPCEGLVSLLLTALDATADGILVVDRAGKILLMNEGLRSLWNLCALPDEPKEEDAIVRFMLTQVEDPDAFRARLLELQARPQGVLADVVRLKDGRVFERQSRPQRLAESVIGRVWSYRDISEHDRLLQRALFLGDATRLLASLEVERALEAVARLIVSYSADRCAVDLLEQGSQRRLLAISRRAEHPVLPALHPCVLAGRALVYSVGERSYLGAPFLARGAVVGALTLGAPAPRCYTQSDLELAEQLARRIALAIENARLYRGAQEALRVRDEFLSIAAHEIRGPITSLHLAVQALDRGKIRAAEQPKLFAAIEREDRRLVQFVDELLDVSRIRAGALGFDLQEVDLAESVRNVAARMSAELARYGTPLSIHVDGPVRGSWDRFRLEQVIANLLSNAIKFGLGKPIVIRLWTRPIDGRAFIAVEDQGMGIAAELKERIWRPFERGVPVRHFGGLGLGLYITKSIVEGLGGCVKVDSVPDAGSTFLVELPQNKTRPDKTQPQTQPQTQEADKRC